MMKTRSTIQALAGAAILVLVLTGCAFSLAATADTPAPTSTSPVSVDDTCRQLSELEQIDFDARQAYAAGELTQEAFADTLKDQVKDFGEVRVEPGTDLAEKLKNFVEYVETVGPDPDGAPFVRGSVEYRDVALALVQACIDAGSDIVITSPGG